ncbi:AAA family ATPase [Thermodesulfobacteriota bacterium]
MKTKPRSINKIIEEQVQKWQIMQTEKKKEETGIQVVTISREPGSGGNLVAKGVSKRLEFDLFHQEVIHEMANSANVSNILAEALDEKGLSVLEDWISSLVDDRHLWPDQYLQHLMKVVGTIGKYGRAVIVGRGANFILPGDKRLSVRVISPQDVRAQNVARDYDISIAEAKKRILRTESNRRAFVRKYFYADIADPVNYDVVINTGALSIDVAADVVSSALER